MTGARGQLAGKPPVEPRSGPHAAGRTEEATATLGQALERYERKRNLAQAALVREKLATVGLTGSAKV